MKKLIVKAGGLLVAAVMVFSLAACGANNNQSGGTGTQPRSTQSGSASVDVNEAIVGTWAFEETVPEGTNKTVMTFEASGTVYTQTFRNGDTFGEGEGTWVYNEATEFVVLNDDHNLSHRVEFNGDVMTWHHIATNRTADFVRQ